MTAWLVLLTALNAPARKLPEVRQLVTFKFLPGRSQEAVTICKKEALPVYRAHAPMLRFRAGESRAGRSDRRLDLSGDGRDGCVPRRRGRSGASLGVWHHYLTEGRAQPWSRRVMGIVAESKRAIVAPLPELSVR